MKKEKKAITLILIGLITLSAFAYLMNNYSASAKWERFLECSKDEGDAGCDSCYILIYGHSIETDINKK